jgi:hypothetical protein
MKIHFSHYRLISAPKPYAIRWISTDRVRGFRINTPKHLFGIGVVFKEKPKPQSSDTLAFELDEDGNLVVSVE